MSSFDGSQAPAPGRRHLRLLLPLTLLLALALVQGLGERADAEHRLFEQTITDQIAHARELSELSVRAGAGDSDALATLTNPPLEARDQLARLRSGDTGTAAFVTAAHSLAGELERRWSEIETAIADVRELHSRRQGAADGARRFSDLGAQLLLRGDELLTVMARAKEEAPQMRVAGRQLVLSQLIVSAAHRTLAGGPDVLAAADELGRDMVYFGEINNALMNGDQRLDTPRARTEAAHDVLRAIGDIYRELAAQVENTMDDAVALHRVLGAEQQAVAASDGIIEVATRAGADFDASAAAGPPWLLLRDVLALLTLASLALAGVWWRQDSAGRRLERSAMLQRLREQAQAVSQREQREQTLTAARTRLAANLGETLEAVRSGRLDVRCEAGDELWNAIGNDALGPERTLVEAVNQTLETLAERLAEARRTCRETLRTLRELRTDGSRLTEGVTVHQRLLGELAPSMNARLQHERELRAAQRSLAREARSSVGSAVDALSASAEVSRHIAASQDELQSALRLVTHLCERGRELRALVRALDDLADEGRILGLNAAIHASLAQSGSGAGVDALSQAVRRLAEAVATNERRAATLADSVERTGEQCLTMLRRAVSSLGGGAEQAALTGERLVAVNRGSERLASDTGTHMERLERHAVQDEALELTLAQLQSLGDRLREAGADSARDAARAAELGELLDAHFASLGLPGVDDGKVVDLRDFVRRS